VILGPVAQGAIGDAYLEMGEQEKALSQYDKAIAMSDNEMTTPIFLMKAGNLLETMGQQDKALKLYTQVKEKYPETNEGRMVDKFIARASIKK
jgi:TolA-binding protein